MVRRGALKIPGSHEIVWYQVDPNHQACAHKVHSECQIPCTKIPEKIAHWDEKEVHGHQPRLFQNPFDSPKRHEEQTQGAYPIHVKK